MNVSPELASQLTRDKSRRSESARASSSQAVDWREGPYDGGRAGLEALENKL